jgi:hypothetical protein
MKIFLFPFALLILVLGIGCQAEQTAVSPIPVIAATETRTGTAVSTIPVLIATETGSGTAVSTPTLPATTTATPLPTATKTAVASPTATPPPFTQGRIVFWWHPVLIPAEPDQSYPKEPSSSLVQAVPGGTPNDWTIQPLLEDIGLFPQTFLSPDQTKLAILVRDDSNSSISDFTRIHIYTFADGSLIALGNEDYLNILSWLPDNQAVVYPQSSNIELARLEGSHPEPLTNNAPDPIEGEPYNYIHKLIGSPDGTLLALDFEAGAGLAEKRWMPALRNVSLFDTQQKAIISGPEISAIGAIDMRWSPDSQWLAFTGGQNQGLSVVNTKTLEIQQLVELPSLAFPVWSPDTSQLAVASDGKISIWDAESQTIQEVTSKDYVSEPAWSPDGSLIAAIYYEEGESGIVIVNPSAQSEEILNNGVNGGQVIWSPEGQWLTGVWGSQKGFGLHVVDKNTGEAHLVLDTAGYPSPSSIMWLP